MKPINEKERTNAFIQFMLLLTVLLILAMILALPNGKVVNKEGALLNSKSKELTETKEYTSNMATQIDSLNAIISDFEKLTQIDYEIKSRKFVDELRAKWTSNIHDTTDTDRIKISIFKIISQWSYDKGSTLREIDKNEMIKTLKESIKQKDIDYKGLDDKFTQYKKDHI